MAGTALASAQVPLQEKSAPPASPAAPHVPLGGSSLTEWPAGYDPKQLGTALAAHFQSTSHLRPTRIIYPEVCAWYGALEVARVTGNKELIAALQARFEPLFTTENALLPPRGQHVDFSMFGSLPFELYILTSDKRYLDLGLSYADAQWASPDAQGLTPETRYWVDDMFMITIVQVQAYRATQDAKYLNRAAKEMVSYLDKLQQPNGLFFHAPDVPYYWGRGNGWFAVGMTEMLRELPKGTPERARIEQGYHTMMASLLRYQAGDGSWRQLIDREDAWPESSGTGMFAYALISGVRHGWLDAAQYAPAARKAWLALAGYIDQDSNVTSVCEGTNKLNDLDYYLLRKRRTGDFHGQSPAMWTVAALLREA
ncbi:glycosyl hydrolase [Silvibacterium dinghuense]|uniref:Glycosyl hydrolase n=2 Tax=Silvibacterium dinghuense TaxID=1560006 RepID=A0A4Q1SKI4_9BACT|nr:glycosyl hydrolase [Silvibacterium dinghuense]